MYGEDLFISFCDKKQKYGFAAAEDYRKNPTFVVFGMLLYFNFFKQFYNFRSHKNYVITSKFK